MPERAVVLGGGPVGIELAQLLRRLGAEVTLLELAGRLLPREEPRFGELIAESLREDGIDVRVGVEVERVSGRDANRLIHLAGDEQLAAPTLVVATGRRPRVGELGLERAGLHDTGHGIEIDERCRAGEGLWAVGDVTGTMPFTHVAKYQAQIAVADICGEGRSADYEVVPRCVFCDPEVAAVGLTEEQARARGMTVATASVAQPDEISRPWTYETDPRGELGVVADRDAGVLVGAWGVAPLASEWIHFAALAIKMRTPLAVLRDTAPQFPSYTEGYLKALAQL